MPSQCSFKQSLTSLTVPSFLGMSHFGHCSTCSLWVYLVLTSWNVLLILRAYLCNLFGVYGRTCFPPKFAICCGLRYVMLQLPVSLPWTDSVNGLFFTGNSVLSNPMIILWGNGKKNRNAPFGSSVCAWKMSWCFFANPIHHFSG